MSGELLIIISEKEIADDSYDIILVHKTMDKERYDTPILTQFLSFHIIYFIFRQYLGIQPNVNNLCIDNVFKCLSDVLLCNGSSNSFFSRSAFIC